MAEQYIYRKSWISRLRFSLMLKALRKSTRKQRDLRLKQDYELHVIEKKTSRRRSQGLSRATLVRGARGLYKESLIPGDKIVDEEIKRLATLFDLVEDSEQSKQFLGSSSSLDWDSKADVESPLKEVDLLDTTFFDQDFLAPALSKTRSVSVSVNRANYVDIGEEVFDLQPVCSGSNSFFDNNLEELDSGLINQDTLLNRNLKLIEQNILEQIVESESEGETMDATAYNNQLNIVKQVARRVRTKIAGFTEEFVTILDKEDYKVKLQEIRQTYDGFTNKANELLDGLIEVQIDDAPRIQEVSAVVDEVTARVKENEVKVKNKVAEVVAAHEASKPPSKGEEEAKALQTQKLKKRIGYIKESATELKQKVLKVKKVKDMTDAEVREGMEDLKTWEKISLNLNNSKQKADEDSVGLDIEPQEILNMQESVQSAIDAVTVKIDNLKLEDKERALYSNVKKNVPKESIVFPPTFKGEKGDNIFDFKEKFEQAIFDSQVREKDRVDVLRKHLKGHPLEMIGEQYTSLDDAMQTLVDNFGHPEEIWKNCKADIMEKLGGNYVKCWSHKGTKQRSLAIAKCVEFLKLCEKMSKVHKLLENEVYHSSTYTMILRFLPRNFKDKFNGLIFGQELTYKEKMDNLMDYLETERGIALEDERTAEDLEDKRKKFGSNGERERASDRRAANFGDSSGGTNNSCRYCEGANCRPFWDAIGCLELYKLQTEQERIDWLYSKWCCYKCGEKFNSNKKHMCSWKGKFKVKCQTDRCYRAAIMCNRHAKNMHPDFIKWIKSTKIDIKHLGIVVISRGRKYIPGQSGLANNIEENGGKNFSTPINKDVRELLQKGDASLDMSDEELVQFFEEDIRKISKSKPDIRPVPEGEAMFIMCVFKGRTRPVLAFIDGGCNCWVANDDIPVNELIAVKLREGPIPMGVASGININANAEWAALLPLADGGQQVVRGLTMKRVTQDVPKVNMEKLFDSIKKSYNGVPAVQNLKVPKFVGGHIDMILGIKYQNIYPELVHQYPNGLAVYKSKLLPDKPGAIACIGGPVSALEGMIVANGEHAVFGHMTLLTLDLQNYRSRVDFFPKKDNGDFFDLPNSDLPGIEDLILEDYNGKKTFKPKSAAKEEEQIENISMVMVKCADCNEEIDMTAKHLTTAVQSELEKFMKLQEAGLETSFRCSRCKDCESCAKGSGYERISLKQEAEQELIKESVYIDSEKGRAMAKLPFKKDPAHFLRENFHIANKRLLNVCKKYYKDENARKEIVAAFHKLRKNGHIRYYEDLTDEQVFMLENAESSYTIPWDVQFKGNSLSTPVRTVLDASSKTSTGYSLNDVLAVGVPNLVMLVDVLLDFMMGPVAFVGDVTQFYPSVGLEESSWPFQKILLREDINPNGKLIKAVIVACIFGVCSSGGQSEEICRRLSEIVKDEFPEVSKLLTKSRYVDDILKSLKTREDMMKLIPDTENALKKIKMEVKGWAVAGEEPPEQLTENGVSVGIPYMTWLPEIDCYKLNISSLHFGRKRRGRFSPELEVFDPKVHKTVEKFLQNKSISRRNCTSVVARIPDILGRIAPLTLRFKHDLRKLIQVNPSWDDPIGDLQRWRWISNFKMIEDVRDIMYVRCPIPPNALNLEARIWILCDAAEGGVMVGSYAGFQLPENKYSCHNLLGKGLLAPEEWTIPRKELHALDCASNVKMVVERALGDWIGQVFVGGDSEIALAWCIYENVKLNVFHRNRVNNIRAKVSLEQLHHVLGPQNPTDVGTRPDLVSPESVLPGSDWLSGKDWMRKSYEEAVTEGSIKSVKDIKLTNEAKKVMKEGVIFDIFDDEANNVAVALTNTIDIRKVAEREAFSNYIYPPLRRSFRPTVRIVSLVLLAVKRFKEGRIQARIRKGKADISELDKMNKEKCVKFATFQACEQNKKERLSEMFVITGVKCDLRKLKSSVVVKLTDEDLSVGLEYLYKKATQEIIRFENLKEIEKISVMKDDILYCKSRILESQELKVVGCLEGNIDIESFTGVKFFVPLVSKNSPLAVSIAIHLHYNVKRHCGVETTYRTSLNHARILQGKQIFKEVGDDCIYCKKLRLRYTKQLMGPLSDTQLTISPIFYFSYLDMWGPIHVYTPGFEKRTRNRRMEYEVYMLVIGCAVTGAINCQIIEKCDTGAVLDRDGGNFLDLPKLS